MHGLLCNLSALEPTASQQSGEVTAHSISPGEDIPRRRRPEPTALICLRGPVTVYSTDPYGTRLEDTLYDGDVYAISPHAPFSLHCDEQSPSAAWVVEVATPAQPLPTV